MPGGGNLNFGDNQSKKKNDYLNEWQNEIKKKEENKKREKQERIRREKEELQAELDYNPFGKKSGPGVGPTPK